MATNDDAQHSLSEIQQSRNQAQMLRDQLKAEYRRLSEELQQAPETLGPQSKQQQGLDAMRKAIAAADCAIESINQAIREMGGVTDEPDS